MVVEDEEALRVSLVDRLEAEQYQVFAVSTALEARTILKAQEIHLLILDVMLPGQSGLDFCRDLRQEGLNLPILMLTAKRQLLDKVLGLKLGADDYLTKPFEMLEVLARVEALLRRAGPVSRLNQDVFRFGDIHIDFSKPEVLKKGEVVAVTALDLKLLRYFIEHPNETLSRDRLLDEVWGYDATLVTRTIDVHMAGLRQKLEEQPAYPRHFVTVHRMGYKFQP
ncbi:MAG: response regulator transcription factor [Acidobacteria bacterium]|nr:response regulator transcription factor [Acidobacteriota bacterium]MCB9398966.1 response regulator transcription factor [Acidobacteriota bacterium]